MSTERTAVGETARWMAAERAHESDRPDRLFDDRFAADLAGESGMQLAQRMTAAAGGRASNVAVRTRYFDDVVQRVLSQTPTRQVVALAAGLDTRSLRLPLPEDAKYYELDQPQVLEIKRNLLVEQTARLAHSHHVAAVDLTSNWTGPLIATGFRPDRPTIWLAEGLICYLSPEAVPRFLETITSVSGAGSHLVIDILASAMLDRSRPWLRTWLETMDRIGAGQLFATDEPEELLARAGWRAEVRQFSQVAVGLGRWPYAVPKRGDRLLDSFLVHAQRQ